MIQPDQVAAVLEALKPYFTTIVEAQLKDYGESANAGCWVSFRVPTPEDLEPFRGQDRSGRNARTGKRYTLMLIELTDQDEHMPQPQERRPMKLSQIAGALSHNQQFWKWAELEYGDPVIDEPAAANLIREVCGIESRALLDTNPDAAQVFRDMLASFDKAKHGD